MAIAITIIAIIVILVILIAKIHNNLVESRNKVHNSFAQIDAQLQRRFDLIPNLVETVKGYAAHEQGVLENVAAARSGYMNAKTTEEKLNADNMLTETLKSLFAVSENYPELKANQNFANLQNELSETENKVTYARQFYNDSVTIYNTRLQKFPTNIIGNMLGFKPETLFKVQNESANQAPKVQF